ncbi:hypothetical protein JCM19046_2450 [Bacillus sp. JCM 19046]|uniref:Uncharacterized membrane protein YcaP (DUF421 family) n=1 Tax=Shouchella xiaoxiensis TaxID=766895 RepID=A0ABS2SSM3_9BACI|nr:DUF421 domain-containing protein [Shouchella xiaoxiensis]MBM7838250.1 uncharacterized membrane protein YcaP (DUF421 family) [Shouchella xiaoxiensis]GAF12124.1 hypothetical protein JCM19045_1282 [Bacillus sp. JCM 19045]GAF17913.1 hypothetical protein JCM19046_2450 [Bacillus sp. JCM 19046]
MQSYISLTTELIIGFFALLLLSKVLGKNQITQLTPFDFISALVVGELLGNAIYDEDISLRYVLYAIFIWGSLIYTIEMLTQKFRITRGLLEGTPSVVIAKGRIQFEELKKNKLDLNQLQHLLREKGVFTIREVEYGILETNGSVNIQRKQAFHSPTNKDLMIQSEEQELPLALIMDGEVIKKSLKRIQKTEEWLQNQLSSRGISSHRTVLYAEWIEGKPLFLQTYEATTPSETF